MIIHNPKISGSLQFPSDENGNLISLTVENGTLETKTLNSSGVDQSIQPAVNYSGSFTGSFVGDGSSLTGVSAINIDALSSLGGATIAQGDNLVISDAGTEKKVTFSNLEDSVFGNISGDVVIAAGGVATIQANSVVLTTDTTGDYVGTITGGTGITSTAATSGEGTTHSLSVDAAQTQITSVGTIGTGTWQGTTIAVNQGGTGVTTKTGTGNVVLSSSPTLVTPALGTPSALVGTNISGTAASLTVGATTGVEAGADVTDAANVLTSLPAGVVSGSDQVASTFAQTILDDTTAGGVRTTIGVDAAGTVNYTLPTNLAGDAVDIDTTALTGATIISDLDINITTNTSGLVTDANGTVATRELTKGDIGLGNVDNTTDALKPVSTAGQTALDLKANLASPTLTGNPVAPTQADNDNSTKIATTAYVQREVSDLLGGAPAAYDTLLEISASIANGDSDVVALTTTVGTKLAKASNLSDLSNAGTARTNLGIAGGTAGHFLKHDGTFGLPSYTTNTNTTYSIQDGELSQINFTSADNTKLDAIEASADVTDSTNVVAALTAGTNVTISAGGTIASTDTNTTYSVGAGGLTQQNFTTTLKSKLDAIEASADVTDAANVLTSLPGGTVSGSVQITHDSTTGFVGNEHIDWTTDQGATNLHSGNYTDTNTTYSVGAGGLTQQNFTTTLKSKLDAIEASADVTDTANVKSALNASLGGTATFGDSSDTITVAGNLVVTGTTTTENIETLSTSNGIIFEGTVADDFEGTLKAGGLTADRVYTLPDTTGTVALTSQLATVGDGGLTQINFTSADNTKLDGIETSATADQTAAEIRTLVGTGNSNFVPSAGTAGHFLKHDGTFGIPSYTTNTNTTYSVGDGGLTTNDFTDADHSKLNAIEASATADQSNAEIVAAVEAGTDSNTFTDADHSKLNAIEASADVTDSTNVVAALTAGTNVTISAGGTIASTDTNTTYSVGAGGLTQQNFTTTLKSKLDAIEASATADQSAAEIRTLVGTGNSNFVPVAGTVGHFLKHDGTFGLPSYTTNTDTNTQLSQEQVEDFVGGMLGGTETGITVTYQDTTGDIDFVVATQSDVNFTSALNTKLSGIETSATADQSAAEIRSLVGTGNSNFVPVAGTVGHFLKHDGSFGLPSYTTNTDTNTQLSTEAVQDIVGAMFSGNTETRISATYVDGDGTIDLVADDMTANTNTTTTADVKSALNASLGGAATIGDSSDTITFPGSITVTGTTTTNNVATVSTSNGVIFEGNAADAYEVTLLAGSVTADRTITLPDTTGTVALTSQLATVGAGGLTQQNFTTTLKSKLDAIEASATADQTAAQIRTLVGTGNSNFVPSAGTAGHFLKHDGSFGLPSYTTNTNTTYSVGDGGLTQINFTSADNTKLDGIETSATADQTKADINALDITEVGTISSGVWQGSVIADAYLSTNTAHLSGTQTLSGAKTFSNTTASTTKTTGAVIVTGGVGISGALNVGGDIVAYASSDERLKDNIELISNPIEKVQQLKGVTWDWNSNADILQQTLPNVGVIAQDVEKVLPQLVIDRDNGFKGVDYAKLTGLLIEAIKEQQIQIEELKSKIS